MRRNNWNYFKNIFLRIEIQRGIIVRPYWRFEYSNLERGYNDCMWMENYWFKSETFLRMFWDLCFVMILWWWWWWWCCMLVLFIIMHSFILKIGRTSIQWWPVQRGTLAVSLLERNQRHENISNIPMIPVILVPHTFEKEMVALHWICIIIYVIVLWVWLIIPYNLLLLSCFVEFIC